MPMPRALLSSASAWRIEALSISRPSSDTAPLPPPPRRGVAAYRGDADQPAVERHGALPFPRRLLHGLDDALRLGDLGVRWREHLVGKLDLRGVDRPFHLEATHCGALRRGGVAVGVGEITERPVDGTQAIGAAGDHHAR